MLSTYICIIIFLVEKSAAIIIVNVKLNYNDIKSIISNLKNLSLTHICIDKILDLLYIYMLSYPPDNSVCGIKGGTSFHQEIAPFHAPRLPSLPLPLLPPPPSIPLWRRGLAVGRVPLYTNSSTQRNIFGLLLIQS